MDTIDIKFKCHRDITSEERDTLKKSKRWIHKVRRGRYHDEFIVVICLPKYFFPTNAYLITTESEVKEVIEALITSIAELRIVIREATVIRVDYPFTYLMDEGYEFNSYRNILYLLSEATALHKAKNFEDSKTQSKETYYYCDGDNTKSTKNKITIYDQNRKIYDKDKCPKKSKYISTLNEFPNLGRRMRIEASLSVEIPLKQLNLKKVKKLAHNFLEEHLFNEDVIRMQIRSHGVRLAELLRTERQKGTLKIGEFIERERPLEYNQVKEAAKLAYDATSSMEKFLKIAKANLIGREEQSRIIIIKVFKKIQEIKSQLKREMRDKTR